ncbi:RNA 3'-terminal phosphate cyclase domain-containing protein [Elsinoe ampelina]|uniref:RNA 3'-terminal phosphate cyclase domain-containing protein n=1 Tax=Elsinoe ampelina TaxID=302913 RepID=A0A6A6GHK5_9PEZI|nr:RNA 3'-terminal phosphate cyclase domain-containing protein [Elsinoe ampelina]
MVVQFDGKTFEGGGQLVRTAICLSALTGKAIRIDDVRGNRAGGGGLKAQHLTCVHWLQRACAAKVDGDNKGSKTLQFRPGKMKRGLEPVWTQANASNGQEIIETHVSIGSAGSTTLALQAILPFVLFSDLVPKTSTIRLNFSGGTNVPASLSFEYVDQVLLPTLRHITRMDMAVKLHERGWTHGPATIGHFTMELKPAQLASCPVFNLCPMDPDVQTRQPTKIRATCIVPKRCMQQCRTDLTPAIQKAFTIASGDATSLVSISCEDSGHDKRLYIILVATVPSDPGNYQYRLGADWLYDRKLRSHEEAIGDMIKGVVEDLARQWASGAYVDKHMRDQLVIFQSLADGRSKIYGGDIQGDTEALQPPDLHAQTAEWVCSKLIGATFDGEGTCDGIALRGIENEDVDLLGERLQGLQA